jgi:hypothetical protein
MNHGVSSNPQTLSQWPSILAELYDLNSKLTEIKTEVAGKLIILAAFHYTELNSNQFVNEQGRIDLRRSFVDTNEQLLLYR